MCGQASDRTIHIRRFADGLLDEDEIPEITRDAIGLPSADIDRLLNAARLAHAGGITLFTTHKTAARDLDFGRERFRALIKTRQERDTKQRR